MKCNLIDWFEDTVEKFPHKTAIISQDREITFLELKKEALKIAAWIMNKNISKRAIGVYIPKSINCIISILAVLYSDNFYTIIDCEMPITRVNKIINNLEPDIILTISDIAESLNGIISDEFEVIDILQLKEDSDKEEVSFIFPKTVDTDLAYILYTSGSTGNPKGVAVSHRAVIAYIQWVISTFSVNESFVIGNQAPFYFSMSVLDIYLMIFQGATLHIIPKHMFMFPIKLLEYIKQKNINFIYWVPTALCLVADFKALGRVDVACLKYVLFAGEVMPTKQYNIWKEYLPKAVFANLYGPTEVTDICNYYIIDREIKNTEVIPIGEPCENVKNIIITANNQEAKRGEIGELYIGGTILAQGYYKDMEKTKEAFVQNPLHNKYLDLVYKTGDLVKYNSNNELVFVARVDAQIKHMGYRIELGEIEVILNSIDGITRGCCLYDHQTKKIVYFYATMKDVDEVYIQQCAKSLLPKYMMPTIYRRYDSMPINANGKINRNLLLKEYMR